MTVGCTRKEKGAIRFPGIDKPIHDEPSDLPEVREMPFATRKATPTHPDQKSQFPIKAPRTNAALPVPTTSVVGLVARSSVALRVKLLHCTREPSSKLRCTANAVAGRTAAVEKATAEAYVAVGRNAARSATCGGSSVAELENVKRAETDREKVPVSSAENRATLGV